MDRWRRAQWDDAQRTRWRVRLLLWTGGAVALGAVVALVYAVHPLLT